MVNCEFSSLELYEMLEAAYPEMREWTSRDVEEIKKHLTKNSIVLDAGCGWGRVIKNISPFCNKIVGIDTDAHEIEFAKTYLEDIPNAKLYVEDMKATSFPDESFDVIMCIGNTFGNLAGEKEAALLEMKRLMKKTGKIIISVYAQESTHKRADAYRKIGFNIDSIRNGRIVFDTGYVSEGFSEKDIYLLFGKSGLKTSITKLGIGNFIVATL